MADRDRRVLGARVRRTDGECGRRGDRRATRAMGDVLRGCLLPCVRLRGEQVVEAAPLREARARPRRRERQASLLDRRLQSEGGGAWLGGRRGRGYAEKGATGGDTEED